MNAFELDKPLVAQAPHNSDFDYREVVGAVEETKFFRLLLPPDSIQQLRGVARPRARLTRQATQA